MKAQILRHTGDEKVDEQVRWVRRHSEQFGNGNSFARYIEGHCPALCAVYSGETGRVSVYAKGPKAGDVPGFPWSAGEPLAVWDESPKWSIEPGRMLYLNGQLVCSIQAQSSAWWRSPADVDGLARKIVDLLNEKGVEL